MTKEEAVNILRANVMVACDTSDKVGYGTPLNKAIEEALDMAIKALEQQPNDDCVSRQAVHNMLEDIPIVDTDKWFNWLQKACLRLADLPPVTPTHGTCKDCKYSSVHTISLDKIDEIRVCRIQFSKQVKDDYYCGYFEKRGSENEVN